MRHEDFEDARTLLLSQKGKYQKWFDESVEGAARHIEIAKSHQADADFYRYCLEHFDETANLVLTAKSPAASGDKKDGE